MTVVHETRDIRSKSIFSYVFTEFNDKQIILVHYFFCKRKRCKFSQRIPTATRFKWTLRLRFLRIIKM